jgi:hypothetical protein
MKKIIYSILFGVLVSLSVSACTEEEVKPSNELEDNGGGGATDPWK